MIENLFQEPLSEQEICKLMTDLAKVMDTLRKYDFFDEADMVEVAAIQLLGFSMYFYKQVLQKKYPSAITTH
jgi:hypothetical protein